MKPRRVNIICDYASLYGGNFVPSIFGLAKSLKEKGCFVMFTFPSPAKERNWAKYLMQEGMQLNFISFSKSFEKEIKHLNKKYEINLIYTHFKSGLRMKLLYPFSKRVKIVVHEHSDFTAGKKINWLTRFKNFVEHKILRKDASYIFVSSSMKEKHKGKKYFYVPNALSLNRIPCQKLDIDALKKEYAISSSDTVFLTFAWSPYVKGTDIAVEAFRKANLENKNAKLLVIHGRDDGYNKCATFLKNQIGDDFLNDDSIILLPPSKMSFLIIILLMYLFLLLGLRGFLIPC